MKLEGNQHLLDLFVEQLEQSRIKQVRAIRLKNEQLDRYSINQWPNKQSIHHGTYLVEG